MMNSIPIETAELNIKPTPATVDLPAGLKPLGRVVELLAIPLESTARFKRMRFAAPGPVLFAVAGTGAMVFAGEGSGKLPAKADVSVIGRLYQIRYVRDGVEFIHPFTNASGFPKLAVGPGFAVAWPVTLNADMQLV